MSAHDDLYLGVELANRYRLDALIGSGGMGAVYRATDLMLGRIVAIKMLRHDIDEDDTLLLRFIREVRAAARITHPNMVIVYDFGFMVAGGTFLVMEYIEGPTLRQVLEQGQMLSIAQAAELMGQIARAVDAAHQAGVIHRDLKPENIMLKDIGENRLVVKLIDLGIAKLKEAINRSTVKIIDKTEGMGTPPYMSPEQCLSSKVDERSDIYSLGIIFYEMTVGDTPFDGSIPAIMHKHLYEPAPCLCERRAEVPQALERLIMLMLCKRKEDRPGLEEIICCLGEIRRSIKLPVVRAPSLYIGTVAEKERGSR